MSHLAGGGAPGWKDKVFRVGRCRLSQAVKPQPGHPWLRSFGLFWRFNDAPRACTSGALRIRSLTWPLPTQSYFDSTHPVTTRRLVSERNVHLLSQYLVWRRLRFATPSQQWRQMRNRSFYLMHQVRQRGVIQNINFYRWPLGVSDMGCPRLDSFDSSTLLKP